MANSNGWGDGAANNSIGWGQGANNNIGWGDSHAKSWAGATDIVGITTDADAQAFITAAAITDPTQQTAINNLVVGLKADGLWSKMKAVYPFVTDNRNLLGYTEDFGNAYWTKANLTVTANSAIAPNGTLTADTLIPSAGTNVDTPCIYSVLSSTVETRTLSFYAKPSGYNYAYARVGGSSNTPVAVFLLTGSGSVVTNQNNLGSTIESVGDGWYRCTMTYAHGVAFYAPNIGSCSSTYTVSATQVLTTTNGTSGTFIWGAHLDAGSTATTYQPIATTQQAFISSQFKYNLVNPVDSDAAFRLVFNGGWTHSSNGATPNGTNGYANTYLNPSSVLTNNNYHLSHYSRTQNILGSKVDIASANPAPRMISLSQYYGSLSVKGFVCGDYNTLDIRVNNTDTLGLMVGSRTSQTSAKLFMDGIQTGTTQTLSNPNELPTSNIFIGANGNGSTGQEFSDRQVAFSSIGNGLTDTEAANLYTRVQAFQTSLSRQV